MVLLHRYHRFYLAVVIACSSAILSFNLHAEQLLKTDRHNIHYNSFNSAMLTAEIAKHYGLQRSTSLGVINISVLNKSDQAVIAFIEGHAKNSLSQIKPLKFKKITEGAAIYYIATFNFVDMEYLTFNFYVVPEGESRRSVVSFTQQFFVG